MPKTGPVGIRSPAAAQHRQQVALARGYGYGKGGIRALNMLETILPATEIEEEEVLDWIQGVRRSLGYKMR